MRGWVLLPGDRWHLFDPSLHPENPILLSACALASLPREKTAGGGRWVAGQGIACRHCRDVATGRRAWSSRRVRCNVRWCEEPPAYRRSWYWYCEKHKSGAWLP